MVWNEARANQCIGYVFSNTSTAVVSRNDLSSRPRIRQNRTQAPLQAQMRVILCDLCHTATGDLDWSIKHTTAFIHQRISFSMHILVCTGVAGKGTLWSIKYMKFRGEWSFTHKKKLTKGTAQGAKRRRP